MNRMRNSWPSARIKHSALYYADGTRRLARGFFDNLGNSNQPAGLDSS